VGRARGETDGFAESGVRLRRVQLQVSEQHPIHVIHGLTISGSAIHAYRRI
jgi:hypothetical protein